MGEINFRSRGGQALIKASMCVIFLTMVANSAGEDEPLAADARRPRARDIGLKIGILPVGKQNAITDVPGVRVGHTTVVQGQGIRTGVTVILPHGENIFQDKVPAAIAVGNGFGKLVGVTQVNELGVLETPIALTNTLSTFVAADALLTHTLNQPGNEAIGSVNPVVGECNDGVLNDIRGRNITADHVQAAIDGATAGAVLEGSVGAGTGTRCMGWKGGIGTSSRLTPKSSGRYSIGVLVQTNFNGVLNVAGVPVGRELGRYYLKDQTQPDRSVERGSCIVVVATDAPLDARQLQRLARRALLGLAAVGSPMTHGSGDYVIAFSVHKEVRIRYRSTVAVERKPTVRDDRLSPLFLATKEATEEAVINSLLRATSVTGFRGRTSDAIPVNRVIEICKQYGAIRKAVSAP